jgi:AcrR family transcriptional regulator
MVVLAEKGPEGATVGEIARQAHVSSGTFYNHFLSISDLVEAVTGELSTGVEIGRDTLGEIENDPAMRVLLGSAQLLSLADEDPVAAAAFVALLATVPDFRDRVRQLVSGALADGIESGRFVQHEQMALTDAVLGSVVQWMRTSLARPGASWQQDHSAHHRILLGTVGVPAAESVQLIERLERVRRGA